MDFYENQNGRIFWYPVNDAGEVDKSGDSYWQVAYTTKCDDVVRYGYINTTTANTTCDADDKNQITVQFVKGKNELEAATFCYNFADLVDLKKEVPNGVLPYDKFAANNYNGCSSHIENSTVCNKFYAQDDIDNASPEIADKMRLWNLMSYMRNEVGGVTVTNNPRQYRAEYNYYVTMNDGDPTVYLWSDRITRGDPSGGTTYECVDANGNKTQDTDNPYNDKGKGENYKWKHTYFKGADLLYISEEDKTYLRENYSWVDNNKTCYLTQYDGGWKRFSPEGMDEPTKWNQKGAHYSTPERAYGSYENWRPCVLSLYNSSTNKVVDIGDNKCGLCSGTYHVFFVTASLYHIGTPAAIPLSFLKADANGVRARFFEDMPSGIQGTAIDNSYKTDVTYFACKKGDKIANTGAYTLLDDVPKMQGNGYKYAYHVSGWRWDDDAIRAFGADINKDVAHNIAAETQPIVAYATNIDELKEESDNASKHYWCVARDTLFIYDNTFNIDPMPSFVVCDDEAQLKGEAPGEAAGANASGKWTVKTNTESVTVASPNNAVTTVSGLPAGETQFNWEVTRWTCKANRDVFVYYNVVESKPGNDIYTCDDFAQLEGVAPQSPSIGTWTLTKGSSPNIKFGDAVDTPDADKTKESNNNKAWVFDLNQGDNPLTWTVENPMPPSNKTPILDDSGNPVLDANGNPTYSETLEKINGHTYMIPQSCPKSEDIIVHDMRPDDAIIETGEKVTSP